MASAGASSVVAPVSLAAASSPAATSRGSTSTLLNCSLPRPQNLSYFHNGMQQVWNPIGHPKFETFSYLAPLIDEQIAKQMEYMIQQNSIPCIEFEIHNIWLSPAANAWTLPPFFHQYAIW